MGGSASRSTAPALPLFFPARCLLHASLTVGHAWLLRCIPAPAERALDFAVAQSYDAVYGARPLRRWLEHAIITPLSRMIISGGCLRMLRML